MQKARAVDNLIVEVWVDHPDGHRFEECLPVATAALFIDVPDDVKEGATWDGTQWVNPPEPEPSVVTPEPRPMREA